MIIVSLSQRKPLTLRQIDVLQQVLKVMQLLPVYTQIYSNPRSRAIHVVGFLKAYIVYYVQPISTARYYIYKIIAYQQ